MNMTPGRKAKKWWLGFLLTNDEKKKGGESRV